MNQQFSKILNGFKEFWGKLTKKMKLLIKIGAAAVLLIAVGVTVALNMKASEFVELFPNASSEENAELVAVLKEMEVPYKTDLSGKISVPAEQWDQTLFDLASKGYPKSTPNYDTFLNNTGFTTTEYEQIQLKTFQLQDRMQETLKRSLGVRDAIVTLNIPESRGNVWDKVEDKASASVMLTLDPEVELVGEQVTAIKNLVAYGVPTLKPEDVTVYNAGTGLELKGEDEDPLASKYSFKTLEYIDELERRTEEKVLNVLSSRYQPGAVKVAATVVLDTETIKEETKEYSQVDPENPTMSHTEQAYTTIQNEATGGIVGEENNTDEPPGYNAEVPEEINGGRVQDYSTSTDFENSYSLTQRETSEPRIKEQYVGVFIRDEDFDEDVIKELVANAVGIETDNISVSNLDYIEEITETGPAPAEEPADNRVTIILVVVGVMLLLLAVIITVVILLLRKKQKQKMLEEEAKADQQIQTLQAQIEEHKLALKEAAEEKDSKGNEMTREIRKFAEENPEMTAALLRSIMQEDGE